MLMQIKNSKYLKLFWGFMALYIFNICVDAPDSLPNNIPEDLSFNDQESIIEILIEKVLGFEEAIPEYDDNDTENQTTLENHKTVDSFILSYFDLNPLNNFCNEQRQNILLDFEFIRNHYLEIYSPPPEV